MKSILL